MSDFAAIEALVEIARGRRDNGRPLGGEDARQIARKALVAMEIDWVEEKDSPR